MDINNEITKIFYKLIDSGITYIVNIVPEAYIVYKIGNEQITLSAQEYEIGKEPINNTSSFDDIFKRRRFDFTTLCHDYTKKETNIVFAIGVRNKTYFVPKLNRIEMAKVITTLEETIKSYEESVISDINSYFRRDAEDEL